MFSGSFDKFKAPVALAYYVQGVVKRLDDDQTIFMDHKCKALLNIIGNKVIDYADALAISLELAKSQNRSIEENMAALLRGTFDMFVGAPIYRDYGARDATVLFDQEVYGCNSPVTQQVIANIMLRLNQRPR